MSKIPTPEELRNRLSMGHFGNSRKVPPGDPIQPTPMVVRVTEIDLYDNNPRSVTNEKYEEIKESVRASGLEQPISITRRPGTERYMADAGGNTRLRILKELHQEFPDDPRFLKINVLFQPWVSETHVLAKHLKENDLRGSLTFIDRARGIVKMRELLEQEHGQSLSYRELSQALKEKGYNVDPGNLSRLEYAATTLLPLIPLALENGLGKPQIEKIRRIEKALIKYLDFLEYEDQEGPLAIWHQCLAEIDTADENLPIDSAYQTLAQRLEPVLQYADAQSILIDLDLLQAGKKITRYDSEFSDTPSDSEASGGNTDDRKTGTHGQPPEDLKAGHGGGGASGTTPTDPTRDSDDSVASGNTPGGLGQGPEADPASVGGSNTPEDRSIPAPDNSGPGNAPPFPSDLKSLRGRLWTDAFRLAQAADIDDLMVLTPMAGPGFFIDLPDDPLAGSWSIHPLGDDERGRFRSSVWWLLVELGEQNTGFIPGANDDGQLEVLAPQALCDTRWFQHLRRYGCIDMEVLEPLVGNPWLYLGTATRLLNEKQHAIYVDMLNAKRRLVQIEGYRRSLWLNHLGWHPDEDEEVEATPLTEGECAEMETWGKEQ